jgi:hypothetical protein
MQKTFEAFKKIPLKRKKKGKRMITSLHVTDIVKVKDDDKVPDCEAEIIAILPDGTLQINPINAGAIAIVAKEKVTLVFSFYNNLILVKSDKEVMELLERMEARAKEQLPQKKTRGASPLKKIQEKATATVEME